MGTFMRIMHELDDIRFAVSNICTAFDSETVGSRVDLVSTFIRVLDECVRKHDRSLDRAHGQHYIVMPDEAKHTVSAGDGLRTSNVEDYVIRSHREGPKMFLRREFAGEVQNLAVVVYTKQAYLIDPDYDGSEDVGDCTHVIVAVLASSGPKAPVTPFRFVHNLAGGNNSYKRPERVSDSPMMVSAFERHLSWLESTAKDVLEYWSKYSVVSD